MTDSNVFDSNPGGDPSPNPQTDDVWADKLKGIKNEVGEAKYKTVEDALDALGHSQTFIEQLKAEKSSSDAQLAELQAELSKRQSVEDVVNNLLQKNQDPKPQADPLPKDSGLDEKKVAELVSNMLQQRDQASQAEININTVSQELSNKFGDSVGSVIAERAKAIGTTPQALKELSASQPKMVLELFAEAAPTNKQPTTPTSNTPKGVTRQAELSELKPEKSIMRGGATSADVSETMKKIKAYTYEKLGVVE